LSRSAPAAATADLTLVSWNIKFLSTNADGWTKRRANITDTLRSLMPDFIAIQELMSGDGGKSDGGKHAAEDLKSDLGANWMQT
jgi:endonuclease/exonuclease/phosphatase family metal-dependent hydrolase